MTDLGLYSALASVAAITTGVQSAVALAALGERDKALAEWREVERSTYTLDKEQTDRVMGRAGQIRRDRGRALIMLGLGLAVVSGASLLSWGSTLADGIPVDVRMATPFLAVTALAIGSFVATVRAGLALRE